jgi:uncharacterized protein (TIGR00369 family)
MSLQEKLQSWIDEERQILDVVDAGAGPGPARLDQVMGKSGLEVMQGMLRGEIPYAEMARTLTFGALSVAPGEAVFQGTPRAEHRNPMGTIHGGWIATLLDSALGSAVLTKLPAGHGYSTAELSMKYLKPLTPNVMRVRAAAKVTSLEGRVAKAEAQMFGPDGTVYAEAKAECRLFEPRR